MISETCPRDTNDAVSLKMYGLLTSEAYQRAKLSAETLRKYLPEKFPLPEMHGMFDVDWDEFLTAQRRENGGGWWDLHQPVAVYVNDRFIGSDQDLFEFLPAHCVFDPPTDHVLYDVTDYLNPDRTYCFMDIAVGNEHVGSFTFELFSDVVPKTCENFLRFCTGELNYEGSLIHRIAIPSFIQGGILKSDQVTLFPDENYAVSHDKRGILSMANNGANTNGSQFFIILSPARWMDQKYVAFGRLIEGSETLAAIERVPTYYEMPTKRIQITACGLKYAAPSEAVPKEVTSEILVRSMLDEIIDKMGAAELEAPDERDAESVLTMEKYKKGEYSPGITEDMLSDVESLDEDLPESLKIVWLILRNLLQNKAVIQVFARRLVNEIVDTVLKKMKIKDAFSKWPGHIDALQTLVRKVLKDTKRLIDVLDLGPKVVIVRELLDEVLDCAISLIKGREEMVSGMLEEIVNKSTVMACVRQVLTDMVKDALESTSDAELKQVGEETEKPAVGTHDGEVGSKPAEDDFEENTAAVEHKTEDKTVDNEDQGDKPTDYVAESS